MLLPLLLITDEETHDPLVDLLHSKLHYGLQASQVGCTAGARGMHGGSFRELAGALNGLQGG